MSSLREYERDVDQRCQQADAIEDELQQYPADTPYGRALRQDLADIARIEKKHREQARMLRRRG